MTLGARTVWALLVMGLATLGRVTGDVESTLARCCVLGANWAREEKGCAQFPTPVQGEPSEHQSICLTSAAICCLRFYREQQCEAGKAAAQRGQDCRLPATEGGEYYKDCCEGCQLGLVSGSMALSCSFRSLQFGFPWDAAYSHCCSQLHPDLPVLPPAVDDTRDNSVLYPGSQNIADSENLCLLFPGQLCAHVCVPVPGSFTCQCRAGFTLSQDEKTCLQDNQGDRCSENDACEHICRDTGVAIECACDPGYRLANDQRTCHDIDECTAGLHSCMPGEQVCYNQEGTYACVNPDGSLTSPWVAPLNSPTPRGPVFRGPLAVGLGPGGSDVIGGSPTTDRTDYFGGSPGRCPTGYRYNSRSRVCDDIDECLTVQNLCGRGGLCTNTIGSYTCTPMPRDTCPPGYLFDLPLQSCLDIDECAEKQDNCDHAEQFCINTQGGFVCQPRQDTPGACPAGYKYNGDNSACEDVDECAEGLSVCREDEVCRNSVGAYDCDIECDLGFQFSLGLQTCVDIDECREGLHSCSPQQECVNEPGSHRCEEKGYTRLDANTRYGDELLLEGLPLTNSTRTVTAEVKKCPAGLGFDFSSRQCLDIDECQGGGHNCTVGQERCINTLGSFRCRRRRRCPPGYSRGAGGDCVDVDECEAGGRAICMPGQICVNGPGSFECQVECRDGFRYDPSHPMTCADIDECLTAPCGGGQTCTNTEGSYVCRGSSGSHPPDEDEGRGASDRQDYGSQTRPLRPSWRGSQHEPSVRPTAVPELAVSPREEENNILQPCSTGYKRPTPSAECQDVDECSTGAARCRPGEVCINHSGGYRCRLSPSTTPTPRHCPQGHRFSSDTNACIDVNECEERRDSCTAAQTCINSVGSYRCIDRSPTCSFGYRHDPATRECLDVNECQEAPCAQEERCRNTLGSFECHCKEGFREDSNTGRCKDINECQQGTYDCESSQRCDNTIGSYTCVRISGCGTGYTLNHNNGLCEDINECSTSGPSPCRPNENCINLQGSHTCQPKRICGRGFRMTDVGDACIDIDECATNAHECGGGQECINRQGTYTCQCPPGYRMDRARQCQDIDECTSFYGAACSSNAACQNTPGSFLCNCHDGFTKTEGGRNCIDVDECSADPNVCHHRCINVRGGYHCICNAGYNLSHDNRTCIDVDECEETRGRRGGRLCVGVCENTPGSFQCTCPSGYTLSPDQRTCKDSNECDRASVCRNSNEQCINTRGGHRCMEITCPQDYIRDTSHKSRCKKRSLFCHMGDLECAQQPLSYSYNFLPLVSNMSLPSTGQVDLFTMRGPLWSTATVHFALDLETTRAPGGITPATRDFFRLRRTSVNQAVISLVTRLEGPQEVQLALSMKLYHEKVYSGSAVAKLLILVSEYDF